MVDILCLQRQQEEGRLFIAKDMNCDSAFIVSDIWPLFEWVFFLPGDLLVLALMEELPEVATFLELTPAESFGGSLSGVVSFLAWAFVLCFVAGIWISITETE